jgi:hypothetical protein
MGMAGHWGLGMGIALCLLGAAEALFRQSRLGLGGLGRLCMVNPANIDNRGSLMTLQDVEEYAGLCGITLRPKATGPYLRLEALVPGYAGFEPVVVGYLTAFVRPLPRGMLHLGMHNALT